MGNNEQIKLTSAAIPIKTAPNNAAAVPEVFLNGDRQFAVALGKIKRSP